MHTDEIAALLAQLTNKMRWAINSSFKDYGKELPFQEAMQLGSQFAQHAFEEWLSRQSPTDSPTPILDRTLLPTNGKMRGGLTGTKKNG